MAFMEERFPDEIAIGAEGGPTFSTDIVTLGSGFDISFARWVNSLWEWDVATGIKETIDLEQLISFAEVARGRANPFRFKNWLEYKSTDLASEVTAFDQTIGFGDGVTLIYQLTKTYTFGSLSKAKDIKKPVAGTVKIAVDGVEISEGSQWTVDTTTGLVSLVSAAGGSGAPITAGFEFDYPARFKSDIFSLVGITSDLSQMPQVLVKEIRML